MSHTWSSHPVSHTWTRRRRYSVRCWTGGRRSSAPVSSSPRRSSSGAPCYDGLPSSPTTIRGTGSARTSRSSSPVVVAARNRSWCPRRGSMRSRCASSSHMSPIPATGGRRNAGIVLVSRRDNCCTRKIRSCVSPNTRVTRVGGRRPTMRSRPCSTRPTLGSSRSARTTARVRPPRCGTPLCSNRCTRSGFVVAKHGGWTWPICGTTRRPRSSVGSARCSCAGESLLGAAHRSGGRC